MPESYNTPHHQLVVDVPVTVRGAGSSDSADLLEAFPASPMATMSDADVEDFFVNTVLAQATGGVVDDEGHTFGTVRIDYSDAPNVQDDVVTGAGGLPGNPHAPNIVSPGDGVDPASLPAGDEVTLRAKGAGGPFPGYAGGSNPSATSATVAPLTIGSLGTHGHSS